MQFGPSRGPALVRLCEATKQPLPDSVLLKWTQPLRSLEALPVCGSMGVDRFNADPQRAAPGGKALGGAGTADRGATRLGLLAPRSCNACAPTAQGFKVGAQLRLWRGSGEVRPGAATSIGGA